MNWRAKSPARLEVFMGVLLYVNIGREDTSPEAINRCADKYGHVILKQSNEENVDHLIRQLATLQKQVPREDVLASIRMYSPRSRPTRQRRTDIEAILAK